VTFTILLCRERLKYSYWRGGGKRIAPDRQVRSFKWSGLLLQRPSGCTKNDKSIWKRHSSNKKANRVASIKDGPVEDSRRCTTRVETIRLYIRHCRQHRFTKYAEQNVFFHRVNLRFLVTHVIKVREIDDHDQNPQNETAPNSSRTEGYLLLKYAQHSTFHRLRRCGWAARVKWLTKYGMSIQGISNTKFQDRFTTAPIVGFHVGWQDYGKGNLHVP